MTANQLSQRQNAIMIARQVISQNPVYLDTETTGLEKTDEIVDQLSMIPGRFCWTH